MNYNYIAYHIINGRARLLKADNAMYAIGDKPTYWAYYRDLYFIDCSVKTLQKRVICTCDTLAVAI